MNYLCVYVIFILLPVGIRNDDDHWNYANDSAWGGLCSSGLEQSPINLVADKTVLTQIFGQFKFYNYDTAFPATMINNGHTVTITLETGDTPILISGGGLIGNYTLDSLHFHWESEHTVDGNQYPLEMHLVHYSVKYNSLSEAAAYSEGIAVLGVFFERSLDDDDDFIPLIEVMEKIAQNLHTEEKLQRNIQARSFLPRNTGDYYRYKGSLTTPNCNEGVIWTVFHRTLPLSASQIRYFESVWSVDGPLILNYRSIQPLNSRTITVRNIEIRSGTTALSASIMSVIMLATLPAIKSYLL